MVKHIKSISYNAKSLADAPIGDLVVIAYQSVDQIPKTHFGGMNRHFRANQVKIKFAVISKRQIRSPSNLVNSLADVQNFGEFALEAGGAATIN